MNRIRAVDAGVSAGVILVVGGLAAGWFGIERAVPTPQTPVADQAYRVGNEYAGVDFRAPSGWDKVPSGRADVVRFVGRATMRRLRGSTPTDEVSGQTITYNNASDVYNVAGGPSSAAPAGRVRGVLSPRPQAEASGASVPGGER